MFTHHQIYCHGFIAELVGNPETMKHWLEILKLLNFEKRKGAELNDSMIEKAIEGDFHNLDHKYAETILLSPEILTKIKRSGPSLMEI